MYPLESLTFSFDQMFFENKLKSYYTSQGIRFNNKSLLFASNAA